MTRHENEISNEIILSLHLTCTRWSINGGQNSPYSVLCTRFLWGLLTSSTIVCSPVFSGLSYTTRVPAERGPDHYSFIHSVFQRRHWHPTLVLSPGKSHGQRSLVGCCPWGRTELDTTEATQQQQQHEDRQIRIRKFLLNWLNRTPAKDKPTAQILSLSKFRCCNKNTIDQVV